MCGSFFRAILPDPDTEIAPFVRRLVKDMGLPVVFAHYIAQSMQVLMKVPLYCDPN